ncbi:hypothetical protein SAMN05443575_4233 [Jatrophihabitans endophyticus]|uniref:Uncharacterized protein n=1 Tax=Jatrophihabitans endophyticus TaxID=1206085 RepID=A0A1M5ULD9_9ACTN|nr:hypothetical protein [Jatrophihabitans endophyticus]SHH63658.1 hypothetical protein SAMN05443575_4233 [Jatrophihabitans endophyticus]
MAYDAWSGPARALARAVDTAVRAALADDLAGFTDVATELRRVEPEVLAVLLGTMTQALLERTHPDGLDSDDAEQVLAACERAAVWYPGYERDVAVLALVGALGVHPGDDGQSGGTPRVAPAAVAEHGLLLVATLLPAPRDLAPLVDAALRELHRAQTVELP